MHKRILITGGCGFIGSGLAVHFAEQGFPVTCLDNFSRVGSEYLAERVTQAGCTVVRGDIRCIEDLERVEHADILIECSAEPSVLAGSKGDDVRHLLNINLLGALNCFEWARKRGSGIIFMSTSRVYPIAPLHDAHYTETPSRFQFAGTIEGITQNGVSIHCPLNGTRSLYGASKLAAEIILEEYAHAYNLPSIINRCGVIAGPWQLGKVDQGVFTYWLAKHYFKKPLQYIGFGGTGKQVRDLLHIQDLCELITMQIQFLSSARATRFNAGGGLAGSLSLQETTLLCRQITGNTVDITPEYSERPFDLPWYVTDNTETTMQFGWTPSRSPACILQDTHDWLAANEEVFARVFNP